MTKEELIKSIIKKLKNGELVDLLDPDDSTKYRNIMIAPFEVEEDTEEDEIEEYSSLYYFGTGSYGDWHDINNIEKMLEKDYDKLLIV